ncbi:hypothetical protein [Actinomadura rugatobispora]|uniref:Uncharacterized protein n=1 Tax=Actinomadura rugatobispora TaxID=1994 RepID=A0ABW1A1K9_9ACTN|nr:hypothetical protein GCM10010200_063350 [Actinomadura rugatobispora]
MDGIHESEPSFVYHVDDRAAAEVAELAGGAVARMFALVQEYDDDNEQPVREVVAYGMELPGGLVMTVPPSGAGLSKWQSPDSASRRTGAELVWLG